MCDAVGEEVDEHLVMDADSVWSRVDVPVNAQVESHVTLTTSLTSRMDCSKGSSVMSLDLMA